MPKVDSFLSIAEDISLIKSIKANAVAWLLRNPNCFEDKILCKFKKFSHSVNQDFLKKFWKSWKNWYWSVVAKKCWIMCLKNRNYFSDFERSGKHTSRQRKVHYRYKRLNNILKRLVNYVHGYNIISSRLVSPKWFNRRRPLVVAAKWIQKESGSRNRWAMNIWARFYLTNSARCW